MKVFAISDLHLSTAAEKPMDIFGPVWENHFEKIRDDWQSKVTEDDIVLMPGDFSWAMTLEDARRDFDMFSELKGHKIILKGNHDYWWNTLKQVRNMLPQGFYALQNDALKFGNTIICGTRGWQITESGSDAHDVKIYKREVERLKLSLNAMKVLRNEGDRVIGIMHYPPFNAWHEQSEFIKMFIQYNVDTVVYGHLHGKESRADKYIDKFNMRFYLVSTDILCHTLREIPSKDERK
ncbi:MAG: metallophosphoesterase [Clostridia bacterium]|nr:metallophosphoesterase [Clostridia bacterium]